MPTKIQLRRGAASSWTSVNPTLSQGELGFESDTGKFKIGDGSTAWNSLGYSAVKPSDLDELAQDAVNTALTAGTGITKTYNDGANTITVAIDSTVTTNSGSQTLTNKTLTSPIVTGLTLNDSSISFEGSTANEFETILTVTDPTADNTITLPNSSGTVALTSQLSAYAPLSGATFTGAINGTSLTLSGDLIVNGTTTNINTTNLVVEDKNIVLGDTASPSDASADGGGITLKGTTDKTFNWVDSTDAWTSSEKINLASGKVYEINNAVVLSSTQVLGKSVPSGTIVGTTDSQVLTNKTLTDSTTFFQDETDNTKKLQLQLSGITTGQTRILTAPDVSGTIITTGDSSTVTNTMLAGSIANNKLANSSVTVNGTSISLGSSGTITANTTNTLTIGTGLSGSSFNGNSAVTIAIDSTVATLTGTQTFTNKTFTDSTTSFQDDADNTKKMQFQLSGITSGQTRTLTIPNVSGTIITTGDSATVSNTMLANSSVTVNGTAISLGSSGTITVPISTGVSGLAANVATFLATPSSANLISAITDETGSGALVFGTTPTLSTPVINNPRWGYTTTATAGGTTTLTNTSNFIQIFTGSSNQTVQMPVTSTLAAGQSWEIENNSTGTLTVNSSGGNLIVSINPGHSYAITCIGTTLTTAADWNAEWNGSSTITGTGSVVLSASPTLSGTPLSTTAAADTNTTQIATTAYVIGQASASNPLALGTVAVGTSNRYARADHVHPTTGLVTTISFGTTGLTPNTATSGAITVAGTLAVANGGTGITSFGTGIATWLGTPSSANLASAITDETGSGSLVFGTSPTIATPTLTLATASSTTDARLSWDTTNKKIQVGNGTAAVDFASSTVVTNAQTGTTYTTVLADKDKMVELNNASAITLSIPTNASVAYPVGTQINILQTGAGQVTIAAATPATTTVNGTPGLKLRAQWSAATLIKRATDTWVVVGDLSA